MVPSKLVAKAILFYAVALGLMAAMFFVPAGTLDYWQAWLYLFSFFVPAAFIISYFLAKDPEFLARRMRMKENEARQRFVQKAGALIFIVGFLLPGLDRRFGWSSVPFELVVAADAVAVLGYAIVFWVFKTNSYAGRTIMVEKGQKVISSGPYSIIRHPMYAGASLMYLATPLALGSFVAVLPFLLWLPLLFIRIKNEEELLQRELKGYKEYCRKVKCRLVPGVW